MAEPLFVAAGVTKSFYDNVVLKGVDFVVQQGSVAALCGENGAGKSTLVNIINGSLRPNEGQIFFRGKAAHFHSPADAIAAGIAFIPQEILYAPDLSVAETIFLGGEPTKGKLLDYSAMNQGAAHYLEMLALNELSPKAKMKSLRIGEMQLIEIAKAISQDADLIIMDEPTTALTEVEVGKLFGVIEVIAKQNKSVIFISHRMNEIFQLADHILVLRDGVLVLDKQIQNTTQDAVTAAMLGKELAANLQQPAVVEGTGAGQSDLAVQPVLELHSIGNHKLRHVDLSLASGEVLGIFGLLGAGRTTLLETIFGAVKIHSGALVLKGAKLNNITPKSMISRGLGYITEDRKHSGLILAHSVCYNAILSSINKPKSKYRHCGLANFGLIQRDVCAMMRKFLLQPLLLHKNSCEYSGGNQQKIVLGKWMLNEPNILLLDEPTKGIDIGAKAQIYQFIADYVRCGNSVVLVSSELPELLMLSDRIAVLNNGSFACEQQRHHFDPTQLMLAAS